MKRLILPIVILFLVSSSCGQPNTTDPGTGGATVLTADFGEVSAMVPDPAGTLATGSTDWYKDAVFYHVWLRAFSDSNGDGIGDLKGVEARLDYLRDLGVTALWLSPFFQNNSGIDNLHGYDVTDETVVDPRFGTLQDVKDLLLAAHLRGVRVIFDFVPNHVSDQSHWFQDSLNARDGKEDWFIWKSAPPKKGWTDIGGGMAGSGFHWAGNGMYYYGIFGSGMPDLNYRNPDVKTAMANVVIQWLNLGFDGLRVDAVKYLLENLDTGANADQPETLALFQALRSQILDPYSKAGAAKFMVAENWTSDASSLRAYLQVSGSPAFQATLDFPFGWALTSLIKDGSSPTLTLGALYDSWVQPAIAGGGWTFSFLNNHDNYQSRPISNLGSEQRVRVAQALQMAAWGTPVLYYGNEIAMAGVEGQDTNLRQNFDWSKVAAAQLNPDSIWNWQKTLNTLKQGRASLRRGDFQVLTSSVGTVALARSTGSETTVVVANLTNSVLPNSTVDLSPLSGSQLSTLVGASSNLRTATTLTVSGLPAEGVRFLALEAGDLPALRGDFVDGPSPVTVRAVAKDGPAAALVARFYRADGKLLSTVVPTYTGVGDFWIAETTYPASEGSGFYRWTKTSTVLDSGNLGFTFTAGAPQQKVSTMPYNTGTSSNWYLRGILGDWSNARGPVSLAAVMGQPLEFMVILPVSKVPAGPVTFKINESATSWDYFFGATDVLYDGLAGDSATAVNWHSDGTSDDNMVFTADGLHSYEIHFLNSLGTSRVWIKRGP